ncbi:bifunctional riboflavin kinase/FAD synthetase [Paenibacillus spiritus]|uniref:Riboflavin biosynthesis protein n=1 Tax=Paenibacillus spiritus TaxID=2496557 RepID=A0A5J5GEE1_9BACL|nr:bifunctional riboflavin kinase/FAD synthetase [Paenibacillus spiritus]KAA9006437.1 bifunctional riboflavin kinase/FAD synthetase [Paenibacillus spiritus]
MRTVMLSFPLSAEAAGEWGRLQIAALGQFDGLHRGHASVIAAAVARARREGLPCAVITFHPHPKDVMGKGNYDGYLTPPRDKRELLADMGIDVLYILEFDEPLSRISPEQFVDEMLRPLRLSAAVVGFDYRFGYKGEGDAEMLQRLGEGWMQVETAPPFLLDGVKVSSSGIRRALQEGDIETANAWFGRPYRIRGTVAHGEKRGRTIGFPTANVKLEDRYVIPATGVYAVRAGIDGRRLDGVMNVGVKPTFHEQALEPSFEVHLFDFEGDLYGREMEVELISFIRPERKFDSVDALIRQIGADAEVARQQLR